jgi:hypothetical protein
VPKPIRRCLRCRHILPPWARADTRYCSNACRQAAHREHHRWRRASRAPRCKAVGPIKPCDRQVQIADIEQLMAATDATVERVMANVSKIRTKPSAASA